MTSVRARTTITLDWPCPADRPDRKPVGRVQDARRSLLGVALLCAALPAMAVSLGEVETSSRIGDILQVRIPLSAGPEEGVSSDCIRLEGPRSETGDDLPWLRAGRLRVTQSNGQQQLLITSLQSIHSPAIMLAVRIDCNATLRREYTLLLNPPSTSDTTPALPSASITASSPPGNSNAWRVARGESLRSIARSLFPASRSLQSRYLVLLRKHNADKLQGIGDSTPLPPGTELAVPDTAELNAAPTLAERPVSAQPAPSATVRSNENPAPLRKSTGNLPRQRLVLGGDERSGLRLETGLSGRKELSEQEREKLRTELQLIATLDDKIATQLELSEKLRQLEALQVQLQSDVRSLEERIRTQQAALHADGSAAVTPARIEEGAARKPVTSRDMTSPVTGTGSGSPGSAFAWQDWWLPAGGIVALLLLFLAWRRYRDSNSYLEAAEIAPLTSEEETGRQPADDLFEPLSEEDIWPDAATIKRPAGSANTGTDLPGLSDLGPASVLHIDEDVEEHNSAVELAEIMMSFGRVQGAAQTLADFIRANPKQAVKPWVKLLEVYKTANMRPEFDALTSQLNKTFNVKPVTWDDFDVAMRAPESLEHIEHIASKLCESWGKRECQAYLHSLLRDNRQGTRQGFPLAIVDEILLLLAILESHLGPYKPDIEPAPQPVPEPTSPTITAPSAQPGPQGTLPPPGMTTSWRPKGKDERSALNFDIGTTDFDLGLDTDDLTRTLHINLDDLPDEPTRTNVNPRKQEDV